MKVAPLYEVKNRLSEYVVEARRRPVIITRNGRPCAAIVPVEEDGLEAFLLGHHPEFTALLDRAYERTREAVPLSQVEREVARRERRRR